MPSSGGRKLKTKFIHLPGGVIVPVQMVSQLDLKDLKTRGQDYAISFVNTRDNTTRKTHTKEITSAAGSGTINVQRVDEFSIYDSKSHAQELRFILDNKGAQPGPHEKTHFRYWASPPSAALPDPTKEPSGAEGWIKVQVIDTLRVGDAKSSGQEFLYLFSEPRDGSDVPSDDVAEDAEFAQTPDNPGKVDNPDASDDETVWIFDPLQNVVDFSAGVQEFIILTGGPRLSSGNTAAWIMLATDAVTGQIVPKVSFEEKPFNTARPDIITDGGTLSSIETATDVLIDYWGNSEIFGETSDPVIYDKSGTILSGSGLPPPPAGSDPRGKPIFSDSEGTIFCTDSTTIKWTSGDLSTSAIIWQKTGSDPGAGADAAIIDQSSGNIVIGKGSSVTVLTPSGAVVSDVDISDGGAVEDFARDCSYVIYKSHSDVTDATTMGPGGRSGDITTVHSEQLSKRKWDGSVIWSISRSLSTRIQRFQPVTLTTNGWNYVLVENYATKSHGFARCIGDFVVEVCYRAGWYGETESPFWTYFDSSFASHSAGTQYHAKQTTSIIDVIDKNGMVTNTTNWGGDVSVSGLPEIGAIDWGGTPPSDFYYNIDPDTGEASQKDFSPWPTTSTEVNPDSISHWNGAIFAEERKPRFPPKRLP